MDAAEPGIAEVRISLHGGQDALVAETRTNSDGYYVLADIRPDTYLLVQDDLPGYFSVSANEVIVHGADSNPEVVVNFADRSYLRSYLPVLLLGR